MSFEKNKNGDNWGMRFHYLVSFHLPDVPANESQRSEMGRALRRVLAGVCSDLIPLAVVPVGPGKPDPVFRGSWTVDPVPAGSVVPVLRSGKSERRWLKWDDVFRRAHPLQIVVWSVEFGFAVFGAFKLLETLVS
jgi:hypothetical protein